MGSVLISDHYNNTVWEIICPGICGAGEVARLVKCFAEKHENLSLNLSTHVEGQVSGVCL